MRLMAAVRLAIEKPGESKGLSIGVSRNAKEELRRRLMPAKPV
jgi:hypothetical protein